MDLKRELDDTDNMDFSVKRSKPENFVHFRLLVPWAAAGSIIGKKAENIKNIINQCGPGAHIRVPDNPKSIERLCLITSSLQDIPLIIEELCRPIFKGLSDDMDIPSEHREEVLLLVSTQQAGYIVGKGGATAAKLREESGVRRLKVYKDPLPYSDERVIELRGDKDKVGIAVMRIQELLLEHPLNYEIIHYFPYCYYEDKQMDCGGYMIFTNSSKMCYPSTDYGYGHDAKGHSGAGYGGYSYYNSYDMWGSGGGDIPVQNYTGERPPSPKSHIRHEEPKSYFREKDPVAEKDIYIDDCYTKHVIGARGSQITDIRRMSGATITIAKDDTVENAERNIKLQGTKEQIGHALELINRAIAEKIERDNQEGVKNNSTDGGDNFARSQLFDQISSIVPFIDSTDPSTEENSETIYIPNGLTPKVIGPKGSRIKEVRSYTKCYITIENDRDCDGIQRKICLRGTPKQIHRAKYMVNNIPSIFDK